MVLFRRFALPLLGAVVCVPVLAAEVNFGVADAIALDQPRVIVGFTDPAAPETLIGPGILGNLFVLDTGANGVLLTKTAHMPAGGLDGFLGGNIYDKSIYATQTRGDASEVQYAELGVSGVALMDLLQPYVLNYAGFDSDSLLGGESSVPSVRQLGAAQDAYFLRDFDLNLGGYGGIAGMPLMTGRITELDLRPMTPLGLIKVGFHDSAGDLPAPSADSYTIPLSKLVAHPEAGQVLPGDPLPTFADLPLVDGVGTTSGINAASGTYLLDTGAQLTMITSEILAGLGLGEDDYEGFIEVSGVGDAPPRQVPLVTVDRLTLQATNGLGEATELQFDNLTVGVLDIDGLPVQGILGMNVLASGYFQGLLQSVSSDLDLLQLLGGGSGSVVDVDGAFSKVYFDFETDAWEMRLERNTAFEALTLEQYIELIGGNTSDGQNAGLGLLMSTLGQRDPGAVDQSPLDMQSILASLGISDLDQLDALGLEGLVDQTTLDLLSGLGLDSNTVNDLLSLLNELSLDLDLDLDLGELENMNTRAMFMLNVLYDDRLDLAMQNDVDGFTGGMPTWALPLYNQVPEPATAALLALGALTMLRRRAA